MKKLAALFLALLLVGLWTPFPLYALELETSAGFGFLKARENDWRRVTGFILGAEARLSQPLYKDLILEASVNGWTDMEQVINQGGDWDDQHTRPNEGVGGGLKLRYDFQVNSITLYPLAGIKYDCWSQRPCPGNGYPDAKFSFLTLKFGGGVKIPMSPEKKIAIEAGFQFPLHSFQGPEGDMGDMAPFLRVHYQWSEHWGAAADLQQQFFRRPQTEVTKGLLLLQYHF